MYLYNLYRYGSYINVYSSCHIRLNWCVHNYILYIVHCRRFTGAPLSCQLLSVIIICTVNRCRTLLCNCAHASILCIAVHHLYNGILIQLYCSLFICATYLSASLRFWITFSIVYTVVVGVDISILSLPFTKIAL